MLATVLMSACTSPSQTKVELPDSLRIAIRQPSTLDPASLRDPAGLLIARQIFEPLVRIDNKTLEIKPALARSWQSLDGGTRYVFKLRNARFHNGRNVTSEDVRFALNRLARKDTGSEVAFLLETVVGFPAVNGTGTATELEGVKSLDEKTLEIRLSIPWVEFPYVLSHPSTTPIPRQEFEANPAGFKDAPIGSGPYLVKPLAQRQDFSLT
ncbi:MAG TPA: ABC transporter substrate-binding protein, partial [Actinomycetota bacterium]|nr:ABC transporter substrate-binding protein [Actinomycetota bacterium]